jgi:hypothetical protein
MANIKVQDLASITGADLFGDSESFMKDLSEDELTLQGGGVIIMIAGMALFAVATAAIIDYYN